MPELPEVEAARRAVEDHCIGKKIKKSIVADDAKVIDGVSRSEFEAALLGKTIVAAHRKGKSMWLQLDSPPFPSFQFGMAGAIYIKGVAVTKYKRSAVNDTDEWPSKYSKLFIELEDGVELSFTDKRRFAKVRLLENPMLVPPISELGPDALLEPMTIDELYNALRKKKIGIKALLLDQGFISGVGNWIADEVLYQARIHPLQIAASMSKESCEALHKGIKEVIDKAVEVGADSNQFPSDWIFHSRDKKPGKAFVNGKKIEFINAGGRTTALVPELQKLSGIPASKALVKPQKGTTRKNKGVDSEGEEPENEEENSLSLKSNAGRNKSAPGDKTVTKKSKAGNEDEGDQQKTTRGKRTSARRNSKANSKDNTNQKKVGVKKAQAKGKSKESVDDDDDSDDNNVDMDQKKGTKRKQTMVSTHNNKASKTDGKQPRKRAK